ncbi:Putative ABC transporter ATP-binding protein [Candidatus Fokinia solitaria]|uniref:ABC transporter ATP-binding protein n=1 Tax=Candidatus Fokinia solitaria TaxID=1802984 RepID=A0A2U8BS48_9RICK|nr:ATP-binding cassette domain-containing protein [Candidatus Fokinia solitaria]AWD33128.1 Putative ABC transporter ATP-binding protein [Candidatus Fokinia solitaria]
MSLSIHVKNLSKSFNSSTVLSDISFNLKAGTSTVILGASGSGKSVLLKCMSGLLIADKGTSIVVGGHEVGASHISERPAPISKIGFSFQLNASFDSLLVWQDIMFNEFINEVKTDEELIESAKTLLKMVELSPELAFSNSKQSSGGMQKRIGIARAIATQSTLLMLDEPTSGLDRETSEKISALIHELHHKMKYTVVSVSHDMHYTKTVADNVIIIKDRTIGWSGTLDECNNSNNEVVEKFFHS